MARKRRPFEVFSMSFLDCMSCGFGAVILLFMIINAQVRIAAESDPTLRRSDTTKIEQEIFEGRKNLIVARNTIEELSDERVEADGQIAQIIALIEELKVELAKNDQDTIAKIERIEKLQSDIERLEEEKKRLLADAEEAKSEGTRIRSFKGEGDRQYLTGLKVGGKRILFLIDNSASMLDSKLVNIIRRRNMSDEAKLRSVKWRQTVASVDWLSTQLPADSQFQMYIFNTSASPVLEGSDGVWLDVDDGNHLDQAMQKLRRSVPQNGTNMQSAYEVISRMMPRPDNVFLLVDGLPTQGEQPSSRRTVSGQERQRLHDRAVREIPSGIPINVLLYPMEGDYGAPLAYWMLAYRSGGSFMSVSKDWP